MDIKDWQRFQKDNEILIQNLHKKSSHQQQKALVAQLEQQIKDEEEAQKNKPNPCNKQNIIKASIGILGFACLFLTLYFWRLADMNNEELRASNKSYNEPSNKALQDVITFENNFILHEIESIEETKISIQGNI